MTEIFIDSTKANIGIQITSQSLHALGFEITVFAADGNTVTEQFQGDTKAINPFTQNLKNPPASYKGSYIRGIFSVISPNGDDYAYSILYSILEEGAVVNPNIPITGITTGGKDTTIANFHVN